MSDPICFYGCDEHDFGCAGPKRTHYAMATPEDQRRYAIAGSLAAAAIGVALSFAICFTISRCL